MAWTEASNVLKEAGLPEFLRRRTTSSSSSTVPAEEEFLQEIQSVIPKNIVAQRLKFLEKGNPSTSETSQNQNSIQNVNSNCNQEAQSLTGDKKNSVMKNIFPLHFFFFSFLTNFRVLITVTISEKMCDSSAMSVFSLK